MTSAWADRVLDTYSGRFGDRVAVEPGFGPVSVDVPHDRWVDALTVARDELGCTFFDWLSAVDESPSAAGPASSEGPPDGLRVVCHLAGRRAPGVEHLVVRTLLSKDPPLLASAAGVFAGARWHERETAEMFGISFTAEDGGAVALEPLLLPEGFPGHPLRKSFVLAARVAKEWPGAKEPGESGATDPAPGRAPSRASGGRRRARPPGVPDPGRDGAR